MKIEEQVVSLELAKKLKKLGYPQNDSQWYWMQRKVPTNPNMHDYGKRQEDMDWKLLHHQPYPLDVFDSYATPTVAELGEKLPDAFMSGKLDQQSNTLKYHCINRSQDPQQKADTEANARGQMICYLLENKLIKETDNE